MTLSTCRPWIYTHADFAAAKAAAQAAIDIDILQSVYVGSDGTDSWAFYSDTHASTVVIDSVIELTGIDATSIDGGKTKISVPVSMLGFHY